MLEFALVHIRSIIGIVAMSAVVAYLDIFDPIMIAAYMAAVVSCALLDKGGE